MKQSLLHFNRGRVDPLALARVDQKRVAVSADTMTNWIPRILGPMVLRPGWEYINTVLNNNAARYLAFIFSTDDTALIEVTQNFFRVVIDDVVLTRPLVTTAVTNGEFTTDIVGWTDNSDPNGTAAWETGGFLELFGNDEDFGIVDQQVITVETSTEHALRIVITRGPVVCSVGSSQGLDDYVSESTLQTGHHSLAFTPTRIFYIRFKSATSRKVYVESCVVETWGDGNISAVGGVQIPAPGTANDLVNLR